MNYKEAMKEARKAFFSEVEREYASGLSSLSELAEKYGITYATLRRYFKGPLRKRFRVCKNPQQTAAIINDIENDKPYRELSKKYGVSYQRIGQIANKCGIFRPNKKRQQPKRVDYSQIDFYYKQGLWDAEIARLCHCGTSTVSAWRKANSLSRHKKPLALWVKDAYEMYKAGMQQVSIARKLKKSQPVVSYAIQRYKKRYVNKETN